MIIKEFRAAPATRRFVRAYRVIRYDLSPHQPLPIKFVPPGPEATLGFILREPSLAEYPGRTFQADCALLGLHDMTVRNICPRHFFLFQVAFQPSALHRLFGINADILSNKGFDAADVLSAEVLEVRERLLDARTHSDMVAIAEAYFSGIAERRQVTRDFNAPLRLLRENPAVSIDWLADQTSLSLRQFERCCRDHTGMAPKTFARLSRFSRAFYTRLHHPDRDWLSIAVDCGYFDYQHMARDFQRFTGLTPAGALAQQSTAAESLLGTRFDFRVSYPDPREAAPRS